MYRPDWTNRAKHVEDVTLDVAFVICDTFYYGPENGFSQEQWERLREPLYKPAVQLYQPNNYLLTTDLKGSAAELIRYYQDVVRLVERHGKDMNRQSSYFWMRPLIFARGEFALTFPWYDTWNEAFPLLDALASPNERLVFDDLEQGWKFDAFSHRGSLFLRQGDFDTGEEYAVVAVDREKLAGQVPSLRQRVTFLLRELSAALGHDYWSQRW
jgi:hypothetical protein